MTEPVKPFDPLAILEALERHRVAFILIGELAGVIHGTDEIANSVDICPQMKPGNLERLSRAIADLDATSLDGSPVEGSALTIEKSVEMGCPLGQITISPTPQGTAGYDDLRRKATREPLGKGVRASVARVDDLARILSSGANAGERDRDRIAALRHLADREITRGLGR